MVDSQYVLNRLLIGWLKVQVLLGAPIDIDIRFKENVMSYQDDIDGIAILSNN